MELEFVICFLENGKTLQSRQHCFMNSDLNEHRRKWCCISQIPK